MPLFKRDSRSSDYCWLNKGYNSNQQNKSDCSRDWQVLSRSMKMMKCLLFVANNRYFIYELIILLSPSPLCRWIWRDPSVCLLTRLSPWTRTQQSRNLYFRRSRFLPHGSTQYDRSLWKPFSAIVNRRSQADCHSGSCNQVSRLCAACRPEFESQVRL